MIQLDPYNKEQPFSKNEISFEDAWCDILLGLAHDDMAFDYRSQYYKERFLKTRKGLVDFQKLEIVYDKDKEIKDIVSFGE